MTDMRPFVHLHCHTHFSLLDGANRIPDLVARTKELGMNAVAITDHGNLYGALEFYNKCREQGVKPILGYEAYVAPGRRQDRSRTTTKEASYHLTLLAMNRQGFQNLIHMASCAYLEGFYYKPRIDKALLEEFNAGVICLSGCASSELSNHILADRREEAEQLIAWFSRVFGDRFYLEVQNSGLKIQQQCAEGTFDFARKFGIPTVATNDAHYLRQADAAAHEVLLCVNTRTDMNDAGRMRMESDQFYVRSPQEMYAAFPDHPDAVARSQEISDRVDIELDHKRHFPVFRPPAGRTDIQYLRELCEQKLAERYGDEVSDAHRERLDYELRVVEQMGYASYFLIVWDFVRFAAEHNIPCQARGSACGAIVAYLLGMSNVCPLKYDLLFERFLDPSRTEPPDIDIDFCRDRRQLVIDYTKERYGVENVAQIGTFGTLKAKAVIRDVGRALGVPLARVNEIAKMVPDTLNISLDQALKDSPELMEAYQRDPEIQKLIDIARCLEGLARSAGTHAAGVVVADEPISKYIPLQRITGKDDIITQWDGPTVEQAGLLKMDFLGLRNLTILDKAVQNVRKHRGLDIDPLKLPLDDRATFELLQRGETKGIFQLESGGMRDLLTKMKPDSFHDIIATSALYRPGPLEGGMVMDYVDVKHGRKPPRKIHPLVDEVLAETYGVMVYQEQVMRILNRVGGLDLPAAYRCIKAISKKKLKTIAEFREQYVAGARERGIDERMAIELFELIEKFAGYGFNKCVVGETLVIDASTGERATVESLFREQRDFTIHALASDGTLVPRMVTDVVWNGRKQVYRLRTLEGRTIVATGNHPFRTREGWTMLSELRPGNPIAAVECTTVSVGFDCSSHATAGTSDVEAAATLQLAPSMLLVWDAVDSIEPVGIHDTYDLTVEEDHNFVADGLIVHNSHSTAYGAVAYQTAYLKAHYPHEFMAALLSCGMESSERIAEHVEDCRRMRIAVLPPDINSSEVEFGVKGDQLTFGLGAIKGVGEQALEAIVAERKAGGPYRDIFDLANRVDPKHLTRGTLELLVKAGALDSLGPNREQHMLAAERAVQAAAARHRDKQLGQRNLFGGDDEAGGPAEAASMSLPEAPDWPHSQKLAAEKEVLGFYLTSHPLTEHADRLRQHATHTTRSLANLDDKAEVLLAGMISAIKKAQTKKPSRNGHMRYVNFDLEDPDGVVRCIMWPEEFAVHGERVVQDAIVFCKGRVDRRGREPNLIVNQIMSLDEADRDFTEQLAIKFQRGLHSPDDMRRVRSILARHPGRTEVVLVVDTRDEADPGRRLRFLLSTPKDLRVSCTVELRAALGEVLGDENFRFHAAARRRNGNGNGAGR